MTCTLLKLISGNRSTATEFRNTPELSITDPIAIYLSLLTLIKLIPLLHLELNWRMERSKTRLIMISILFINLVHWISIDFRLVENHNFFKRNFSSQSTVLMLLTCTAAYVYKKNYRELCLKECSTSLAPYIWWHKLKFSLLLHKLLIHNLARLMYLSSEIMVSAQKENKAGQVMKYNPKNWMNNYQQNHWSGQQTNWSLRTKYKLRDKFTNLELSESSSL